MRSRFRHRADKPHFFFLDGVWWNTDGIFTYLHGHYLTVKTCHCTYRRA